MAINDEALEAYASQLQSAGFTVYEPTGTVSEFFVYSHQVDGRECFGIVQSDRWNGAGRPNDGYSHSMPIKPSKEHGSGMFVEALAENGPQLTVEAARMVAQPRNYNRLVGWQDNHGDAGRWSDGYAKREAKE